MSTVIPSTLDEVKEHLNGLGKLVTAKEWERAAIVWAWTREGVNQYESLVSSYQAMTITDFAKLGIINLSSRNSVREYRQRWQSIIDELGDAYAVRPGDEIPPVEKPWREEKSRDDGDVDSDESTSDSVPQPSAEAVIAAIRNNPEVAQQVVADADARAAVARASFEYDGDAEEMANAADPQRAEMGKITRRANLWDAWRKIRYDVDRAVTWTDRELESLSEEDKTAVASQVRLIQSASNLMLSKLTGEFDTQLAALLDEGGSQ